MRAKDLLPVAAKNLQALMAVQGRATPSQVYVLVDCMIPPGDDIARVMVVQNEGRTYEEAEVEVEKRIAQARSQRGVFTLGALLSPEDLVTLLEGLAEDPASLTPIHDWLGRPVPAGRCRVLVMSGEDVHVAHVAFDASN